MLKKRTIAAATGGTLAMIGLSLVGAVGPASASPKSTDVAMAGSVAPWVSHAQAMGAARSSQRITVELWMRPKVAASTRYAEAVSTPDSPYYHHYLSPSAYTARFGPRPSTVTRVESWLRSKGFTAVATDSQRAYVRATASTKRIDGAFHVRMKLYKPIKGSAATRVNAGPYALRSNNRPVTLPASIARSVIGVTGLDNAAPATTLDRVSKRTVEQMKKAAHAQSTGTGCSQYYGEVMATGLPKHFGTTTFPTEDCGYTPKQLRGAYGTNAKSTGKGQTVALVELGLTPDMFLTLQDYAQANGIPGPSPNRYAELSLGQGSACGDPFDIEEQLDVEMSYDMAPSSKQLVVGGDSCNNGDFGLQGLFNADEAILNGVGHHALASIASNSWEMGAENAPPSLIHISHSYLVRAAAEGVGMYFSSGDGSGVEAPSSDPNAIAVGGTTLAIGKAKNVLFQTGWSTGIYGLENNQWVFFGEQGAAGGGTSLLWKEPKWQKGVVPPKLTKDPGNRGPARALPDISAEADPYTGVAVGLLDTTTSPPTYSESTYGGTSVASPLIAGIVADAQQGRSKPFGFISPALYKLAKTKAFDDVLPVTSKTPTVYKGVYCPASVCGSDSLTQFDDQAPDMSTTQVTLKGYDTMTGIGSPNGQAFISGLRGHAK